MPKKAKRSLTSIPARRIGVETMIRESEQRYRTLVQNSPDVIMNLDRRGTILFINHTLPQYTVESVIGTPVSNYLSAEDASRYMRLLEKMYDTGEPQFLEISAAGPTRWLTRIFPIKRVGQIESALIIATDITERKQAEDALRKSEEEHRNIITNIHEIVYMTEIAEDPTSGRLRFVNSRTEDIIGYRPDEFIEAPELWFQIVHPEDRRALIESTRKIIASRTAGVRNYRLQHKETGEYRLMEDKIVPQVGENGKVVAIFGLARDITERSRAKAELEKSVSLLRATLESTADGILVVDREGKIVSFNRKFVELWRIPNPIVSTRDDSQALAFVLEQLKDSELFIKKVRELYDQPDAESFDLLEFKDGRFFERYSRPHRIGGQSVGRVWSFRDVTGHRRSQVALQESQRTLSTLMSNLPGMVYRCRNDKDWTVEFISQGCFDLTGYRPSDLIGNRKVSYGRDLIHPDDQEPVWDDVQAALREKRSFQFVYRIRTASGKEKWVWEQGRGIYSSDGALLALEGFIVDMTERKRAEEALKKSEAQNRALLNAMPDMMFRISREGVFLEFIPAKNMDPLVPPDMFLGKNLKDVMPADVAQPSMHCVVQALNTGHPQILEYQLRVNGGMRDYESRIVVSGADEVLSIVRDITDRKHQAAALEYQALHDTLTDLPNRTLVLDRLNQAIHAADRENRPLALLLMDLDRFKEVNDALGHHHGDLLLKQVGPRVLSVIRESDTIARLGGDEFAVLLPATDLIGATVAARKILEALARPFVVEGIFLDIGASIGIALFPEHGEDVDILMRRADVAMYQAKQTGAGFSVYVSEHDRHSPHRLALMGELRHAVEREELVLHYQPKVDLKTRRTVGVEALVRWQHPEHGLIPPDQFITVAEHTGVIKPLTLWVLGEAARQGSAWHRAGMEISVAVNLSARNLHDLQLPDQIAELLRTWKLPPAGLDLEITESAIMADPSRATEILMRLRAMGIRFSIDDFGAGYSSLSYLRKLPAIEVKVDKSFIIGMAASEDDAVIVRSTIDLAHNLGLKVTAEGVESRDILNRLVAMGCDAAQGYFISRPVPAADLTRWLNSPPWGVKKS
jgi:diguanylate cyclase (GGDEF)-like protein/PAS domain S-box-containing protein